MKKRGRKKANRLIKTRLKAKNNFIAKFFSIIKKQTRKLKRYNPGDYLALPKLSHQVLFKMFTAMLIISIISAQSLAISGFEAHVINVTAKIVNDVPLINPTGGQFCNINGATITLTTTYTGSSIIIYTTNGTDPVCPNLDHLYTAPFTIYQSSTIKARTCHDGKSSAIMSQHFDVSIDYCPPSNCEVESIGYWRTNQGCQNPPAASQWAEQINNLSIGHFQSAFAGTNGQEICSLLAIDNCQATSTLAGQLCRAQGETLVDLSNIVSGRLDMDAVLAGAFNNSQAFIGLGLTASTTVKVALNAIETVIKNPGHTLNELANAEYVAQRIYTFYFAENPYAPDRTCIYYEPGDVNLNELVPNPSCASQPVDVALVVDTSGSMGYDSPTRLYQAQTAVNSFLGELQSNDQSALVSYASNAILDKTLSNIHSATIAAVNNLTAMGATNIGDAISLANQELVSARHNPLSPKVEILLTDGLANKPFGQGFGEFPADVAYAKAKADEAAAQGIKIFTIGLGLEVNTLMLEYIATTTGGQYHFAPTGESGSTALTEIYQLISREICGLGDNDQNLNGLAGEWVELYNKGTIEKNLNNWLIANAATSTVFKIDMNNMLASTTLIGAAGTNEEWAVALFNGARLNNFGDTIFLYDNAGHLLDFYSYLSSIDNDPDNDPAITPDAHNTTDGNMAGLEGKSFARIPDGTGEWIDPVPTPGAPNRLEGNMNFTVIMLNEIATTSAEVLTDQDTDDLPIIEDVNITASTTEDIATSTPDSVAMEENIESEQPAEEQKIVESTEELIAPTEPAQAPEITESHEITEPVETTNNENGEINNIQPEPVNPEPANEPEPSSGESAVIESPQQPAVEPVAISTELTPNSETTTQ